MQPGFRPCRHCGQPMPPESSFCARCGGQLREGAASRLGRASGMPAAVTILICTTLVILAVLWCVRAYIGYKESEQMAKATGGVIEAFGQGMKKIDEADKAADDLLKQKQPSSQQPLPSQP